MDISKDLTAWRQCRGPKKYIESFYQKSLNRILFYHLYFVFCVFHYCMLYAKIRHI